VQILIYIYIYIYIYNLRVQRVMLVTEIQPVFCDVRI